MITRKISDWIIHELLWQTTTKEVNSFAWKRPNNRISRIQLVLLVIYSCIFVASASVSPTSGPTYLRSAQNLIKLSVGTGDGSSSVSGGLATATSINYPRSAVQDTNGYVYFGEQNGNCIRRFLNSNNIVLSFAGQCTVGGVSGDGGPATSATLNVPVSITVDSAGGFYFCDFSNNKIRKVASGIITTFAFTGTASNTGDGGPATSATIQAPHGVWVSSVGNVYITSVTYTTVRMVSNGIVSVVAGTGTAGFSGDGGAATSATITSCERITGSTIGNIYISDIGNYRIRAVSNGFIFTKAGNGATVWNGNGLSGTSTALNYPTGTAIDPSNGDFYISLMSDYQVRVLSGSTQTFSPFAGTGSTSSSSYATNGDNGAATSCTFGQPDGLFIDPSSHNLYVVDRGNNKVRTIYDVTPTSAPTIEPTRRPSRSPSLKPTRAPSSAVNFIVTVAGNVEYGSSSAGSVATATQFYGPTSVWVDTIGYTYIADQFAGCIKRFASTDNIIYDFAGACLVMGDYNNEVPATSAILRTTFDIIVDTTGVSYISDFDDSRVRNVRATGTMGTYVGNGNPGDGDGVATSVALTGPRGLFMDSTGVLYVAYTVLFRIRRINAAGITSVVAGVGGTADYLGDDGPATSASLNSPQRVFGDTTGVLYVSDSGNNVVRVISSGIIALFMGGTSGFFDFGVTDPMSPYNVGMSTPSGIGVDKDGNVALAIYDRGAIVEYSYVLGTVTLLGGSVYDDISDYIDATQANVGLPNGVCWSTDGALYFVDSDHRLIRLIYNTYISAPSAIPSITPTTEPTFSPSAASVSPTILPTTGIPTGNPTIGPSFTPSMCPTQIPSTLIPTLLPSKTPSALPTLIPTLLPSCIPSIAPSLVPSIVPTGMPSMVPSQFPSMLPSIVPTATPSRIPTQVPSVIPSVSPTASPSTIAPTTLLPSRSPSSGPTISPTLMPSLAPSPLPTRLPSLIPTALPSPVRSSSNSITTVAGTGVASSTGNGGRATAAAFNAARAIVQDSAGYVYMIESAGHCVRRFSSTTTIVETFAGSPGTPAFLGDGGYATAAYFNNVQGGFFDTAGNLFVADFSNSRIRKITVSNIISTYAGGGSSPADSGAATSAVVDSPMGIWCNTIGAMVYNSYYGSTIRSISASGIISLLAGTSTQGYTGDGGPATSAQIYNAERVRGDSTQLVYIGDSLNNRVRIVSSGIITTLIGTGNNLYNGENVAASSSNVYFPEDMQIDSLNGDLYFASRIQRVYVLTKSTGLVSTFIGNGDSSSNGDGGPATSASINGPDGLFLNSQGNLYLVEMFSNRARMAYSIIPTPMPSAAPTTVLPSCAPTVIPTLAPSINPSLIPSASPSLCPSICPSVSPSGIPTNAPSIVPSLCPTALPTASPSRLPTISPTLTPSVCPSAAPSLNPTAFPSVIPTDSPTIVPTVCPTRRPTLIPSVLPSVLPTISPSNVPTDVPSLAPSYQPTVNPSVVPSLGPTIMPSASPSSVPSISPSGNPTTSPTQSPTVLPTLGPSLNPSVSPTDYPSQSPSITPSVSPSLMPTLTPSQLPSLQPSLQPSEWPSVTPSSGPTELPTCMPSGCPSIAPTQSPSAGPSLPPTLLPSLTPTVIPSESPTEVPTVFPSVAPSTAPSHDPTVLPSTAPSHDPTVLPSMFPSLYPSSYPSVDPSVDPSRGPTLHPSLIPSSVPSPDPSICPSALPSIYPTVVPSIHPTVVPSNLPTDTPSITPSVAPSIIPSLNPTQCPTVMPTDVPSVGPTLASLDPTLLPSMGPSIAPSVSPSVLPTLTPSSAPSVYPSVRPTLSPTMIPSIKPTGSPTNAPSGLLGRRATLPGNNSISVLGTGFYKFKVVLPLTATPSTTEIRFSDITVSSGSLGFGVEVLGNAVKSAVPASIRPAFGNTCSVDSLKRSASVVGDVNADGFDDLIIGDPFASRCYVLYGNEAGLRNMTSGFTIFGEQQSDLTGWSVSGAGDVNNDSIADIMVGAPNARGVGALYVIYGERHGSVDVYLNNLTASRGFAVYGNQKSDYLGVSVSSAGDVNRDGCDDVIVGALLTSNLISGAAYVLYGCMSKPGSVNGLVQEEGFKLSGDAFSYSGSFVSGAGDVNGDGYDDVLVGTASSSSSVCYLVYGYSNMTTPLSLSTLTTDQGVRLTGAGSLCFSVGDTNHDGLGDFMIVSVDTSTVNSGLMVLTDVSLMTRLTPGEVPTPSPTTARPTYPVTGHPTRLPTFTVTRPTLEPTFANTNPTSWPTQQPSFPTVPPTHEPTDRPSKLPSRLPTMRPTLRSTDVPTAGPTSSSRPTTSQPITTSRSPVLSPSIRPTVVVTPSPSTAVVTQYVNEPNAVVNVSNANVQYVVNVTGSVSIIGSGGTHVYVVLPRANSTLTISHFNKSSDLIDLTAFHYITQFKRLQLSEGSVLITLSSTQWVHILNLHVADMSEHNFKFYAGDSGQDLSSTQKTIIKIVSGLSAGVFALIVVFMIQRGVRQFKKMYEIPPENRLCIVIRTTLDGHVINDDGVVQLLEPLLLDSESSGLASQSHSGLNLPVKSLENVESSSEVREGSASSSLSPPLSSLQGPTVNVGAAGPPPELRSVESDVASEVEDSAFSSSHASWPGAALEVEAELDHRMVASTDSVDFASIGTSDLETIAASSHSDDLDDDQSDDLRSLSDD